jgi:hypothetical protein
VLIRLQHPLIRVLHRYVAAKQIHDGELLCPVESLKFDDLDSFVHFDSLSRPEVMPGASLKSGAPGGFEVLRGGLARSGGGDE